MSPSVELPSGTVTLLFTDIEGSTRLLQQLRDGYGEVLSEHRRLLREAFAQHGGSEIDTQGDAFFVAFRRARDAVAAAVAGQRALSEQDWPEGVQVKVRMGIHTGEPSLGDDGYHGLGLHRAARICAAGHGGQILLSNATRELIEDELPRSVELVDFGERRLKDLDRAERIFQVSYPGVASSFPPLKTLDAQPADTPFRGREEELAAVVATRFSWARRRRGLTALGAGAVLAVGVAVAATVIGGGSATAVVVPANAVGILSPSGTTLAASAPVGSSPSGIAVGEGGIWVTNTDAQSVSRIDPKTNSVVQTVDVGSGPTGVAVGSGFVWVANSLDGTVSQIDPRKNGGAVVRRIKVGNEPTGVAYGHGAVWVTNAADKTLSRIDPATARAAKPVRTGPGADGVAVGPGGVWVTSERGGTVTEIDPSTAQPLQPVGVGHGPSAVAVGAGAVWVANALDGTVSKVDPRRASVITTIQVGKEPSGVAIGHGKVWVSDESGTLSQIDPGEGSVARRLKIGNRPAGIAIGPAGVYVAVRASGLAHRGGTLRIVMLGEAIDSLDPALGYSPFTLPLLSITHDGLVAFRRVGGAAGGQLVPNLAEALPTPSADGRTYAFRVRENIRYSTGRPVRPSDFRHAIERTFAIPKSPGPTTYFAGIVGAEPCLKRARSCDLSRGIVADDRAGTVRFHLVAPDPDFLWKLAVPSSYAVPPSAPRTAARDGLPGTGAYSLARVSPMQLVLARNPHFREWSAAAHPAGYPDRIVVRLAVTPDAQLSAVARGEADWGFEAFLADPARVRALDTRYASQVHRNPTRSLDYVFLNTRAPPFDDVRARQAVNYAVDRRVAVRRGEAYATCQALPPNFPGYRPYCPFRLGQGGDLALARRLVSASGTRGSSVTIWTPDGGPPRERVMQVVTALRRLGYRVRIHVEPGMARYFEALDAGPTKPQAGCYGWVADYTAPSSFINPQLACGAPANFARFCDRSLDAALRRASVLQAKDPHAADALWARIDRRITDLAPWVPLSNPTQLDFVSKRVGNYQYNPQWGVLLDQLWVI